MHSFTYENVTIHYSSDFSGDAKVVITHSENPKRSVIFAFPCEALAAFSNNATILRAISALEGLYQ